MRGRQIGGIMETVGRALRGGGTTTGGAGTRSTSRRGTRSGTGGVPGAGGTGGLASLARRFLRSR